MIDIHLIRKDVEAVQERLRTKIPDIDLGVIIQLDTVIRAKKKEVEELKAKRNETSDAIGKMKREGQECSHIMKEMKELGEKVRRLDHEIAEIEPKLERELASLPNLPMDDIPVSQDPKDNRELHVFGEKPTFSFPVKNHVELNETLQLFEFQKAAQLTGSGWPAYKGWGARLEWALLNYLLDYHVQRGFIQWIVPAVVKRETLFASGQLPKFANQQYVVKDDENDLYMVPTAEVPLNGLLMDEIVCEEKLPLKYVSYTPCFRREAGAAGAQDRGLIRTHQFNKVEMFAFTTPEQSGTIFEEMVRAAEELVEGLELPYRSMLLATGDMSFAAAKTVDIEVWLPGQDRYYEVSSISNCTDYQARRSHIRYRKGKEKPQFVHTLNGSGLATSRLMVGILENNQLSDGSVTIPAVLRPYLGGIDCIGPE